MKPCTISLEQVLLYMSVLLPPVLLEWCAEGESNCV